MGSRGQSQRKKYTSAQKAKADNIKKQAQKRGYTNIKFRYNENGEVEYSYTEKKNVQEVHGGKMQDPAKNDHYERTVVHSGKIGKDGLIKRNKDEKNDVLIQKGRAAERARERAEKRQATREKQAKNARMTAGDWIKNQVNVDIEKYRDSATKQFDKRGLITVDWKRMPRAERAYIEQLATKYPNRIQLFDAGAWAKQIRFRR